MRVNLHFVDGQPTLRFPLVSSERVSYCVLVLDENNVPRKPLSVEERADDFVSTVGYRIEFVPISVGNKVIHAYAGFSKVAVHVFSIDKINRKTATLSALGYGVFRHTNSGTHFLNIGGEL